MPQPSNLGYKKEDLIAAQKLLNIHSLKLGKAVDAENYAEACSALRAIYDECENAQRIATTLSFNNRNNAPRIGRSANTEGLHRG